MHGIVLKGLKDFVVETYGTDGWDQVREAAGVEGRIYVPVSEYPDEEAVALVGAASEVTGQPPSTVLESFGEYLVDPLLSTYGVHVDGDWSSMELLANVETYIHEALRAKQLSTYAPPRIDARRVGADRVVLYYGSGRQFCSLVRGILLGVADHYDETFQVAEPECMLDGADHCEFHVARVPAERPPARTARATDHD